MHVESGNSIKIRFALPNAQLRPFVTTYYYTQAITSPLEPVLEDYLHPEWANLRFMDADFAYAAVGDEPLRQSPAFSATGPTCKATRFRLSSGRSWGIGLMPLGWAALISAPASRYADRVADGKEDAAFAAFRSLADALSASGGDFAQELTIIERHMVSLIPHKTLLASRSFEPITTISTALIDPDVSTVGALADRACMTVRSLERLSKRVFGFTPKLLLRRQRFLRSLAQFMLDPSLKWLNTLDHQYYDQAHFVRDFKQFMGMSPSDYAKLDKPFLAAAAQARMAIAGEAVQGLHDPTKSKS